MTMMMILILVLSVFEHQYACEMQRCTHKSLMSSLKSFKASL